MTCHHHLGIIWVTSHQMKVSERVRISYVSNGLLCDYLRSAISKSGGRLTSHGYGEDGTNDIMQDDESCGTRSTGQCVQKQGNLRMTMGQMMTSSELEN